MFAVALYWPAYILLNTHVTYACILCQCKPFKLVRQYGLRCKNGTQTWSALCLFCLSGLFSLPASLFTSCFTYEVSKTNVMFESPNLHSLSSPLLYVFQLCWPKTVNLKNLKVPGFTKAEIDYRADQSQLLWFASSQRVAKFVGRCTTGYSTRVCAVMHCALLWISTFEFKQCLHHLLWTLVSRECGQSCKFGIWWFQVEHVHPLVWMLWSGSTGINEWNKFRHFKTWCSGLKA